MIILYENINEENNADTLDSKQSGKENCNLMSFEEFKNNIISDSRIKELSDTEDIKIHTISTSSKPYKGMTLQTKSNNATPTINLNMYYDLYKNGVELNDIIDEIVDVYNRNPGFDATYISKQFENKEWVLENLCCRLLPKDRSNDENIFKEWQDLIIDLYIDATSFINSNCISTIRLSKGLLKMSGLENMNTDELIEIAMKNVKMNCYMFPLACALSAFDNEKYNVDVNELENYTSMEYTGYVLTTKNKMYGAVMFLSHESVLEDYSNIFQSDIAIIPSSLHEVLLLPITGNEEIRILNSMVKEVNQEGVEPDDILSDHIYIYNRKDKTITSALSFDISA